jgi:hypothetical protein
MWNRLWLADFTELKKKSKKVKPKIGFKNKPQAMSFCFVLEHKNYQRERKFEAKNGLKKLFEKQCRFERRHPKRWNQKVSSIIFTWEHPGKDTECVITVRYESLVFDIVSKLKATNDEISFVHVNTQLCGAVQLRCASKISRLHNE